MDFPSAFVEKVRASAEEVEARAESETKIAPYTVHKSLNLYTKSKYFKYNSTERLYINILKNNYKFKSRISCCITGKYTELHKVSTR